MEPARKRGGKGEKERVWATRHSFSPGSVRFRPIDEEPAAKRLVPKVVRHLVAGHHPSLDSVTPQQVDPKGNIRCTAANWYSGRIEEHVRWQALENMKFDFTVRHRETLI